MQTADDIIDGILRREGGFVDHAADRGGPTNYGITLKTLQTRGQATIYELKSLTEDAARAIYRSEYIQKPGFDLITNHRLQALVVDCGVLHGPSRASAWLRVAIGRHFLDGNQVDYSDLSSETDDDRALILSVYCDVLAQRCQFIGRLITDDPKQAVFAAGWANRQAEFIRAAAEV